jgi:hypothetical protein
MSSLWPCAARWSFALGCSALSPCASRSWSIRHRTAARIWSRLPGCGVRLALGQELAAWAVGAARTAVAGRSRMRRDAASASSGMGRACATTFASTPVRGSLSRRAQVWTPSDPHAWVRGGTAEASAVGHASASRNGERVLQAKLHERSGVCAGRWRSDGIRRPGDRWRRTSRVSSALGRTLAQNLLGGPGP